MAKKLRRTYRVADIIQKLLAELIQQELKDPRVGMVTLTSVEVSTDLTHAKIYFSVYDESSYKDSSLMALRGASGFLRSRLAKVMQLRVIPRLHFFYDDTLTRAKQIDALLERLL